MKFLLDTNFLLIPVQFKVDIYDQLQEFGSLELYTLTRVKEELEKLSRASGKKGREARLALDDFKTRGIKLIPASGGTDAAIVRVGKNGFTVCTQDRAVIRRCKAKKIPVITMRQKKILARV